jgi:C-terminal processing protease CtpA/Prc
MLVLIQATVLAGYAQQPTPPTSVDRDNAREMLKSMKSDLQKFYYDGAFHGMNLDERFKTADEKLKSAVSLAQLLGIVGQVMLDLDDSHTFFLPPGRTYQTEYGWTMHMIGDRCFVSAVKPGSDAQAKGLKEGDEVVSVDGFTPTRNTLWKIKYLYEAIRPKPGMRVIAIKPDRKQETLDVAAKIQTGRKVVNYGDGAGAEMYELIRQAENDARLYRHRFIETGELFVWKMPQFDLGKLEVDDMMDKVKKRKTLVLDLRGNGGGYVDTLLRLVGNFFDHDVKVGDLKTRKEEKPMVAKTRGKEPFSGKLIVLIDSQSASAAELFARVTQLEKRGTVIGDRSSGAVMRSRHYSHYVGVDPLIPYGVSITDADIIMTDGLSLEHTGVQPDELKLPTGEELAVKRDSVLAYAMSLGGVTITPEKAGAMFPLEWKK